MNENIQKITEQYNRQKETAESLIHKLNKEICDALFELGLEYYSTQHRYNDTHKG